MRQLKSSFGFWATPSAAGPSATTQGTGNPSPEEVERRTLPTQGNEFPHQTMSHTDDEGLKLAVGDPL